MIDLSRRQANQATVEHVLAKYSRAVVHMREQFARGRLGLVLGAGAVNRLGFPTWSQLLERLARHPSVSAPDLLTESTRDKTSKSQLLYQHFLAKKVIDHQDETCLIREAECRQEWHRIVRECLYADVPSTMEDIADRDHYLWAYLPIVRGVGVTITYNFDNTLERYIAASRTSEEAKISRGYRAVINQELPPSDQQGVIYHPNGLLPFEPAERASEKVVFLEDSFADQLIETSVGHFASLAHYLSQSTRLFIGLGIDDPTLKHMLRRNAKRFPGHAHYYVAYTPRGLDESTMAAIRASNWEVYNLVTLFLTDDEIAAIGQLVSMPAADFEVLADFLGVQRVYRWYLTGAVAVGKSTTASHFHGLRTHDEWLDQRMAGMEKDPGYLSPTNVADIDRWVADQWRKKSYALGRASVGLHLVDRAPLDAFAFRPPNAWAGKAHMTLKAIAPGSSTIRLCNGRIILLLGDPDVLHVRAIVKNKQTDPSRLRRQQELLCHVYLQHGGGGVRVVRTQGKSIGEVVKEVAGIVHIEEYREAPLHEWLGDIAEGRLTADDLLWSVH